eukprot:11226687-Lingulodinium_polyedra.AAC.1
MMHFIRARAEAIDAWPMARRIDLGRVRRRQIYQYLPGRTREFLIRSAAAGQHLLSDLIQGVEQWGDRLTGAVGRRALSGETGLRGIGALERA